MRHLICVVDPGKYVIIENGVVLEQKTVALEKFLDFKGEMKAINPTHTKAWDALQRIWNDRAD